MAKEQGFQSFVSIGLEKYNELILKNKEQEELTVDLSEEILAKEKEVIQIESNLEYYQELFYKTVIAIIFKDNKYMVEAMVSKNNKWYIDEIYVELNKYCDDETQKNIIYSMMMEQVRKELDKALDKELVDFDLGEI